MKNVLSRNGWILGFVIAFAAPAAQFKFPNQTLTVPDGFEVELVTTTNLVERPVSASFDEQGRLYVTDSSGSNDKPDKQLQEKPHRVVRLEDTDGDGKFDQSTVFADKMMFPEGCLWFDGSAYVSAPPSIWKLTDTNSDGVADVREEWHQGKTLTGCANDLHGPYLGPDGWIYWCKGAFQEQTYTVNGKPFTSRAAHIFRARPDHSGLEPVLTGGMDNPVGVAFSPEGERFLAGTFFEPGGGRRDGVIHAIYGGIYGKPHPDVLDAHKKTGDLMPVMIHLGPSASCSVISYRSKIFGDDFQNNLLVCNFNLHNVTRHILEPDGATFKTKDSVFLSSDNTDFHPTDVVEDADGSLLVVDTGGWYKICCPTSQLSKPDVLGAIYRIRRVGAPKVNDPRGLKLAWGKIKSAQVAELLDDERPAVRQRAIHELSKRGKSVPVLARTLKKSESIEARRNTVWALTQIDSPAAREAVLSALHDKDESIRHAAIHSVSVWRDSGTSKRLLTVLQKSDPQLQRAAAEALGRIGDKRAVPALLVTSAERRDRILEHSLAYSLIEIDDPVGTSKGLTADSSYGKRIALIALDQMDGGDLKPEQVTPLLASTNTLLKQTASWIVGHHPEWGGALAGFFRDRLETKNLGDADRDELQRQLAGFASNSRIQDVIATALVEPDASPATRQILLRAIAQAGLKDAPALWTPSVNLCLGQNDEALLRSAIAAARALSQVKTNAPNFSEPLLQIARDGSRAADLRLEALAALPHGLRIVEPELLGFLFANVDPAKPVMVRSAAASVLARARLNDEQLLQLANTLKVVGPLEVTKLLAAFERSTNEAVGLKLVAAVKDSKGLSGVRADVLRTLLAKYPVPVQQKGDEVLALLNVDAAKQRAHLDELEASLKSGDVRRGQAVFNSQKTACSACHRIGYQGGNVGPDLTSIGQARTARDLLEAIVYPSASFVRSYEPFIVVTKSDEQYSGVLRKDAADEVVLGTGPGTEVRVARSDITEIRPGAVSVMPAGLDQQLNRQELADLVAFLKGTKWGAN